MRMRLSLVIVLAASLATTGCISNMGELKTFLGVTKAPPPVVPPLAKAQASATSAMVGVPITFSSDGTRDPAGLALTYTWSFGDGSSGNGPTTKHAYSAAGDFVARLVVLNARGAADEATVTVKVLGTNRAPVAAILGAPARATMGQPIAFDGSTSSDPDGSTLAYEWDFGGGATSHDAKPTHAFAAPGVHIVKLTVTDPQGGVASATATIPVDATWVASGNFEVGPAAEAKSLTIVVADGASSLAATLTFDAGLAGMNDITLVVKDASGREVARATDADATPGLADETTLTLALAKDALARHAPGAWSVDVVKESAPAGAAWSLVVRETA